MLCDHEPPHRSAELPFGTILHGGCNQGPASLGITKATSAVVFEEFETDAKRFFPAYKLEGLAILNKNEVAIINDNDFGIAGVPDAATQLWVLRLASQLP